MKKKALCFLSLLLVCKVFLAQEWSKPKLVIQEEHQWYGEFSFMLEDRYLITAGQNKVIKWDKKTGLMLDSFQWTESARKIIFNQENKKIINLSYRKIIIFDYENFELLPEIVDVETPEISIDGNIIKYNVSNNDTINSFIYDLRKGKKFKTKYFISSSLYKNLLVGKTSNDNKLYMLNVDNLQVIDSLSFDKQDYSQFVLVEPLKSILAYKVSQDTLNLSKLNYENGIVENYKFTEKVFIDYPSNTNRYLTFRDYSYDHFGLFDIENSTELFNLRDSITRLRYSYDDKLLYKESNRRWEILDLDSRNKISVEGTKLDSTMYNSKFMGFSAMGKYVLFNLDRENNYVLYEVREDSLKYIQKFYNETSSFDVIRSYDLYKNKYFISGSRTSNLYAWNLENGNLLWSTKYKYADSLNRMNLNLKSIKILNDKNALLVTHDKLLVIDIDSAYVNNVFESSSGQIDYSNTLNYVLELDTIRAPDSKCVINIYKTIKKKNGLFKIQDKPIIVDTLKSENHNEYLSKSTSLHEDSNLLYLRIEDSLYTYDIRKKHLKKTAKINSIKSSSDDRFIMIDSTFRSKILVDTKKSKVRQYDNETQLFDNYLIKEGSGYVEMVSIKDFSKKKIKIYNPNDYYRTNFKVRGDYLLFVKEDILRVYNHKSNKNIANLLFDSEEGWIWFTEEGFLDMENPNTAKGFHWRVPEFPYRPIEKEVFLKEFFKPNLLKWVFSGESLIVDNYQKKNILQPNVEILGVRPGRFENVFLVDVLVENVFDTIAYLSKNGTEKRLYKSGVYDLKLYSSQSGRRNPLNRSQGSIIHKDSVGSKIVTLDLQLPFSSDPYNTNINAIAYNSDNVRSKVSSIKINQPYRSAYLIGVGVDKYEDSDMNLDYTDDDVNLMEKSLNQSLSRERINYWKNISNISTLKLTSDSSIKPTKSNVKNVLAKLSGQEGIEDNSLQNIQKSWPSDVVFILLSGHGIVDENNDFYFVPRDVGQDFKSKRPIDYSKCISSKELRDWIEFIEAERIVIIIDACYSGASFEIPNFKPGSWNEGTFAELLQEKTIHVISASQPDNYALESGKYRQSLLTYALFEDGLNQRKADTSKDGKITLEEWLKYAKTRVPELQKEIKRRKIKAVYTEDGWNTIKNVVPPRSVVNQIPQLRFETGDSEFVIIEYSKD
ncbi:caspase family protein [Winogradskyella flava]|uniref:caspase family protein n=1 Tax=Winogradskyella flava TaxID=1884876 RepID=UPI0024924FC3|nr:caspase family protein [Winogradskyella flava]